MDIRVLVVDDEPAVCELTTTLLSKDGYSAEGLTDPTQALGRLKDGGFHLVILDMMMPGITGTELLAHIRKQDADIPVIVATAHPTVDTAVQSLRLSANEYVEKPFRNDVFLQKVREVLAKKGLSRDAEAELHLALGKAIREARTKQDLTLKHLARRTGLSVSLLSQIERAESSASIGSLYKISRALGVPLSKLFDGH